MTSRGTSSQIPTPRGEEAERLDWWYDRADELYRLTSANQLEENQYKDLAAALDDEGVGEYYRALCDWNSFPNTHPRIALHPLLRGLPAKGPAGPECSAAERPRKESVELRTYRKNLRFILLSQIDIDEPVCAHLVHLHQGLFGVDCRIFVQPDLEILEGSQAEGKGVCVAWVRIIGLAATICCREVKTEIKDCLPLMYRPFNSLLFRTNSGVPAKSSQRTRML